MKKTIDEIYEFHTSREAFPELPALAKRLGVEKLSESDPCVYRMRMQNGDTYDPFALVNAFLDRMDKEAL